MNLDFLDWAIIFILLAVLVASALYARSYTTSVADFLSARRCAGRYLITVSMGATGVGAMSIMAVFEMYYNGGFPARWWEQILGPVVTIVTISGWIVYRFRQTRALTMAQFFEMRYSKRFRLFAGMLSFISGVMGFAIAPAVAGRFFMYYCGLPESFQLLGVNIQLFPVLMLIFLGLSLFFTFVGGQITIMVADFIQGLFTNSVILIILFYVLYRFGWTTIMEGISYAPEGESMVHPFKTTNVKDFNIWFFLIWAFAFIYTRMSWQGMQGYNTAAKNPHEARMAQVFGGLRSGIATAMFVIVPLCAYTIMKHPKFANDALMVNEVLGTIENPQIQKQMTVPVAMSVFLPKGLLGAFAALLVTAFISTVNSHLHSWGSIFIQDIVLPFRKKKLSPKVHLRLLKLSALGVAIAVFLFSLLFRQTSYILMWINITAAIYSGGAGAVIIGGLYWSKGTTSAAWTSLLVGCTIAVSGIIIKQIQPDFFLNEQVIYFISMITSLCSYFLVSLLSKGHNFNMDKLLHRGKYADVRDNAHRVVKPLNVIMKRLGITDEFTMMDKAIYFVNIGLMLFWFVILIFGTAWNLVSETSDQGWKSYWLMWVVIYATLATIVLIWLAIGGIKDLKNLFKSLAIAQQDFDDDGTVNHQEYEDIVDKQD